MKLDNLAQLSQNTNINNCAHYQFNPNMIKLFHQIAKYSQKSQFIQTATQITHQEKTALLKLVSTKLKLGLKPSVLMDQQSSVKRRLSHQQKIELGLYIPKSPFNPRLSRIAQKQYVSVITKQLYELQKKSLQTYVRILQNNLFLEKGSFTLDHYINLIYKDIYARYLISKGVGIEWEGYYANTGVVNFKESSEYDSSSRYQEKYSILLDFIQSNAHLIERDETGGLFSYYEGKYIHHSQIGVEKVKKMGYYIKEQITKFGKYEQQFQILKQKGGKVYLCVMVQCLQKLINPNAICINEADKYIILKKYYLDDETNAQYLIVALSVYKAHEKYFKDRKYQKHNTFDGNYLIGMTCLNLLIYPEIEGYSRQPSPYIVNSNCHISDFERVKAYDLPHFSPFCNEYGQIRLDLLDAQSKHQNTSQSDKSDKTQIIFNQLDQLKLNAKLEFTKNGIKFMEFYDVFDDEVYFLESTKELLHFRIGQKYSIFIPQTHAQNIIKSFSNQQTIISESKIKIQNLNPGKKPREKRQFRKQRKIKLDQVTEHMKLQESLNELVEISISNLSKTSYVIPLLIKDDKVIPYQPIVEQKDIEAILKGRIQLDQHKLQQHGVKLVKVNANQQLVKALAYLRNLNNTKEIRNVIIEPQSQTQELIPYAIHLNYLINKGKARGRRSLQIRNNINLIKLHPTLREESKNKSVQQLIEGVLKSNEKKQYGLGLQALRLWTAANDNYLGNRQINDQSVNKQLQVSQAIRNIFWNLISILPQNIKEVTPQLYLSKFILDLIDSFIVNLEECYRTMNIHQAYELINSFFNDILNQIYVKTIREKIIAFPNLDENEEHFYVIRRILELVAVICPLFPFSAYHISRKSQLLWPKVLNPKFYESIPLHNEMIQIRVKLINKLRLNKLKHSQIYLETLKQPFSLRDLELFFNVDSVTFNQPAIEQRSCSLKLDKNNSITSDQRFVIFLSKDSCIRCDTKSDNFDHLCSKCVQYLEEEVSQPLLYFQGEKKLELV